MVKKYQPQKIEKKWQKAWYSSALFSAKNGSKKEKYYLLFEFPYPSGEGLHVGHCRPYIGMDVVARKRRMQGYNLLFPIGWDAFGLPTENYAIKTGVQPAVATAKNTKNFKRQMQLLGLSLDWSREINTTDPAYYKWTQWIFLQLYKHGLAYKDRISINWCPKDKIGLANEEVINGKCERCGTPVQKREKEQWLIKITKYADRLVQDLALVDYPERVKTQQKEWIGRSEGVNIKNKVKGLDIEFETYDSIPQTFMAQTFTVIAPEHPLLEKLIAGTEHEKPVMEFAQKVIRKRLEQRYESEQEMEGIFTGRYVENYMGTGRDLPIWVASYVVADYGTGIVNCSAHDERDFAFAKKYGIPLHPVLFPKDEALAEKVRRLEIFYRQPDGILREPEAFARMTWQEARQPIVEYLVKNRMAIRAVNYKLRDWVFSRQHYWGEPIPMIYCDKCQWQPVPEKELPVKLPKVEKYQPTDTGESPLAAMKAWVNVKCPACKGSARRETDTMPNWAGSNWYYLAYAMLGNQKPKTKNQKYQWSKERIGYWMPVDWYNGGMEHTVLHLLYSRFIYKFLWDIGAVPKQLGPEPYKKRTSHGIILGPGGVKMSKSRGNVINPDDVVHQHGADTLRVYEMFMGPFEQMIPWDEKGIVGARRFLEKAYQLALKSATNSLASLGARSKKPKPQTKDQALSMLLNKTVRKVSDDIEQMKFNTAVAALMVFVNEWHNAPDALGKKEIAVFLQLLCPFAPHLAEELWHELGLKGMCQQQPWPEYDERMVQDESITLVVQVNGRVRDKMAMIAGLDQKEVEQLVLASPKVKHWTEGRQVKKIIFVQGKLINIVT